MNKRAMYSLTDYDELLAMFGQQTLLNNTRFSSTDYVSDDVVIGQQNMYN